ncbi:MAG: MCE family protein [Planctomycetes bacterium]|nr:MCE family protein [Planctomycetota bacterium]
MEPRSSVKVVVGVFVFAGLLLFAASILLLGERGRYFATQHRLKAFFTSVAGLHEGAAVRLAGVAVGRVTRIQLPRPPERKVLVELNVAGDAIENVRRDSVVRLETMGFLGDKFVEISVGSPQEPAVSAGATLQAEEPTDFGALLGQGRRVLGHAEGLAAALERGDGALPWLINDPQSKRLVAETLGSVRAVTASLGHGEGALPWLLNDPQSKRLVAETLGSVRAVTASLERGDGAVSWLMRDPASRQFAQDLARTAEAIATLSTDVKTGRGLAHALIYDPEGGKALLKASQVFQEVHSLLQAIRGGDGAIPALLFDPASRRLVDNLRKASQNLDEISAKILRGEGTLGALVADPTLYEDLAALLEGAERSRILRWGIRHTLESGREARKERGKTRTTDK